MKVDVLTAFAIGEMAGFLGARSAALAARKWRPQLLHKQHFRGIHIHHYVYGLIAASVGVVWIVADSAVTTIPVLITAVGFGVIIDETAMLVHLKDVYFDPCGRLSLWVATLASVGLWLMAAAAWVLRSGTAAVVTLAIAVAAGGVLVVTTVWLGRRYRRHRRLRRVENGR